MGKQHASEHGRDVSQSAKTEGENNLNVLSCHQNSLEPQSQVPVSHRLSRVEAEVANEEGTAVAKAAEKIAARARAVPADLIIGGLRILSVGLRRGF